MIAKTTMLCWGGMDKRVLAPDRNWQQTKLVLWLSLVWLLAEVWVRAYLEELRHSKPLHYMWQFIEAAALELSEWLTGSSLGGRAASSSVLTTLGSKGPCNSAKVRGVLDSCKVDLPGCCLAFFQDGMSHFKGNCYTTDCPNMAVFNLLVPYFPTGEGCLWRHSSTKWDLQLRIANRRIRALPSRKLVPHTNSHEIHVVCEFHDY